MKLATVIIPHHNAHDQLKDLLACLDNKLFDINICSGNACAYNYNKGAKIAETDKMIFCNDDILPTNENFEKICVTLDSFDIVGASQISLKNNEKYYGIFIELQRTGVYKPTVQTRPKCSFFPHGFCFGIKKHTWNQLGGFNEKFLTGYEDVDFGIRAVLLGATMALLDLEIKHVEAASEGRFEHINHNIKMLNDLYPQSFLRAFAEQAPKI